MPDALLTMKLLFPGDQDWMDVSSLLIYKSVTLKTKLHNQDYKSCIDTLSFSLRPDLTLSQKLNAATEKILIEVDRNGVAYFTGYIKPDYAQISVGGGVPLKVDFTAYDNSFLLDEPVSESFSIPLIVGDPGYRIADSTNPESSILHYLVSMAGYTDGIAQSCPNELTEIEQISGQKNEETYRAILDQLLSEYGYVLTTTPAGQITIVHVHYQVDDPTINLQNRLGAGQIRQEKRRSSYTGMEVHWAKTAIMENALLYAENLPVGKNPGDPLFPGQYIIPGGYFPPDGDVEDIYQRYTTEWLDTKYQLDNTRKNDVFRNKDLSIISVSDQSIDLDADPEIQVQAAEHESHQSRVLLRNTSVEYKKIYRMEIRGTVLYRSIVKKTRSPENSTNPQTLVTRFIFDAESARKLAVRRYRELFYNAFTYSFSIPKRSEWMELKQGDFVLLTNPSTGIDTVARVVDLTDNPDIPMVSVSAYGVLPPVEETTVTSGTLVPVKPHEQEVQEGINNQRPTYQDMGFDQPVFTPEEVTDLSISAHFRDISLRWIPNPQLFSPDHYQIQCADTDEALPGARFAPDRGDYWVNTPGSFVRVHGHSFDHIAIPNGGTQATPTGRTVYYWIRVVTRAALKPDGTYYSEVEKPEAYGPWSGPVSATTYPIVDSDVALDTTPPAPVAPFTLTLNPNPDGSVSITWSAFEDNIGAIKGYRVWRAILQDKSDAHAVGTTSGEVQELTDQSAVHGTTYYYGISAWDRQQNESAVSWGDESTTAQNTVKPGNVGGITTKLTKGTVSLTWNASTMADQYRIELDTGSGFSVVKTVQGLVYDYVFTGEIEQNTIETWSFRITAISAYGVHSAQSTVFSMAGADYTEYGTYLPTAPELRVSAAGRTMYLQWPNQDALLDWAQDELQVSLNGSQWYSLAVDGSNYGLGTLNQWTPVTSGGFSHPGLSHIISGGVSGRTYFYRARRKTAAGSYSSNSLTVSAQTVPTTAFDLVNEAIQTSHVAPGAITAEKIFVTDLAAISGTFGKITGGGVKLNADANNYWYLDTVPGEHKAGAFRIGTPAAYMKYVPASDFNEPDPTARIEFFGADLKLSTSDLITNDGTTALRHGANSLTWFDHGALNTERWRILGETAILSFQGKTGSSWDSIFSFNNSLLKSKKPWKSEWSDSIAPINHWKNVAAYSNTSATGILKIRLPVGWTSTMFQIKIEGYQYTGNNLGQKWTVEVGGYNYQPTPTWNNYYARIQGRAATEVVRLAYDGSRCCVLIGDNLSKNWPYPKIVITDVITGHQTVNETWASGWEISWITSESGLSSIVTPEITQYEDTSGDHVFKKKIKLFDELQINKNVRFTTAAKGLRYEADPDTVDQILLYKSKTLFSSPPAEAPGYSGLSLESDSVIWLAETDNNSLRGWFDLNANHFHWLGTSTFSGAMELNDVLSVIKFGQTLKLGPLSGSGAHVYSTGPLFLGAHNIPMLGFDGAGRIIGTYSPDINVAIGSADPENNKLRVNGTLKVDGTITVLGNIKSNGTLTIEDNLTISAGRQVNASAYNFNGFKNWDTGGYNDSGDGAAIVNDSGTYKALMILGNRSGDGAQRKIKMWDDVNIDDSLTVGLKIIAPTYNLQDGSRITESGGFTTLLTASSQAQKLKVGGLLVADSYSYANPGLNSVVVKGSIIAASRVAGTVISLTKYGTLRPTGMPTGTVCISDQPTDYTQADFFIVDDGGVWRRDY